MSSLDSVLRYRQHLLTQQQAELAKALQADEILSQQLDERQVAKSAAAAEAAAASATGRLDVAAVASRLLYAGQLSHESAGLQQQRSLVGEEIARCRGEVAKADADVKAIEKIIDKRAAEARRQHLHREQIRSEETYAASRQGEDAHSLFGETP